MENTNDRELVLTRVLNAPVDLVWEVWSKPEHIAQWWGPNDFTCAIDKMDLKPGGEWNLVLHGPDGTDYDNKSIFREVIPFKKLVYEHLSYPWILATIDFEERGEQTHIRWHMLFESAEVFQQVVKVYGAEEGQKQNVEKLAAYLTSYAPVNGIYMYHEIHGEGSPLVLIHGGGSTIETTFSVLLPELSRSFKVIAVELQAHGRTSDRDAPESFEQDADDVAALLEYLKIPKANILGFSNGGSTTLQVAIRHPQLVNKIVVISGAYLREGLIPGLFEGLAGTTLKDMPAFLREAYLKVAPNEAGLQVMFEKDRDRMLNFKDWPVEQLRSIDVPALIMAPDLDVTTREHTVDIARQIPGARLAILPGTHGVIIGETGSGEEGRRVAGITISIVTDFLK